MPGGHQHKRRKDDGAVVEKGLKARKGDRGIAAENRGGVDEIDQSAKQSQCANVAAGGVANPPLAPDHKGHGVHPDAAGVKRETAAKLKADFSAEAFPCQLAHFQSCQRCPQDGKNELDFLLGEASDKQNSDYHQGGDKCGKEEVERREHGSGDLIRRGEKILVGKEIAKKIAEAPRGLRCQCLNEVHVEKFLSERVKRGVRASLYYRSAQKSRQSEQKKRF